MLSYQERRKKFFNQRKKLAIHQWLSTAAITMVAVVAASIFIPKEAYAHFIQVESFGSDIFYEVEIVDEENTIASGTLKIVAQNQLEYHEKSLDMGYQIGSFSTLKPNTVYQVSIRAHRGFGEEILSKETITTKDNYGAAVTGIRFYEESTQVLAAEIDVTYNDLKQELKNVELLLAYQEEGIIPLEEDHVSYPISSFQETITFIGVMNNVDFHFIIKATLIATNEVITLFEKTIDTPIYLYLSIYPVKAGTDYIDFSAYLDFQTTDSVTYEIQLLMGEQVIKRVYPTIDQVEVSEYESAIFTHQFKGLKANSHYHLKIIATYKEHLITKVKEEMVDCYTTLPYDVQIVETQEGSMKRLDISATDSHLLLSDFYYSYYDIIDGNYNYMGGEYIQLNTTDQIHFSATIFIPVVAGHQYEVSVSAKITVNSEFSYYWVMFYQEIWNI